MKKILCIVGTRPQIIKHAVVNKHLQKSFVVETINTTQHYDYYLNDTHIEELFGQQNKWQHLHIEQNQKPANRLAQMLLQLSSLIENSDADAVLVYGDTDSTLAGALAANKCGKKLIHVEAGERSYNNTMPEEANRRVTDVLSDILFCVSNKSKLVLQNEQISGKAIVCGDVMKDLLLQTSALNTQPPVAEPYYLCTIHRNYTKNNPQKLLELLVVLNKLDATVFFPVHPATNATIQQLQLNKESTQNIQFVPPLNYSQSIHYQKYAKAIITDSGGMQKEAYWLQRPCITVRKETEWTETLAGNWNTLLYDNLADMPFILNKPKHSYNAELYGSGNAGTLINDALVQLL